MQYPLASIAQALNLSLDERHADLTIRHLLIDSRQLLEASATLFFALPGRQVDGHDFIAELYGQGVRAFVVQHIPKGCPEAAFFLVDDVVQALQKLATFHRKQFTIPVIGITGSNGKTIVKEWLRQLLEAHGPLIASPRSYNSQIGVPLSVVQLEEVHELAIFEAGISRRGEMARLAAIIEPTIGLFTNIGAAHQEGFGSEEEKLSEKLHLFRSVERLIYCRDQEMVHQAISDQLTCATLNWGRHPEAEVQLLGVDRQAESSKLTIAFQQNHFSLELPFTDDNAVENAMHCCSLLLLLGLPVSYLQEHFPRLEPVELRLRVRGGRFGSTLIDDTYSNDLTSLASALNVLDQHSNGVERKVLVLTDMLESGLPTEELYQRVAFLIKGRIQQLYGIGKEVPLLQRFLPSEVQVRFFESTEEALTELSPMDFQESTVLLKGARPFGLERLADRLAQQVHRTILEVNRSALLHNFSVFRSRLRPGVRLAAMVKAAAYGTGGTEVGLLLEQYGVDFLVVAYPDEGRELRQAGIKTPIMVLNAEPTTLLTLQEWALEPEIYHWNQLHELAKLDLQIAIHLKFDTGMHRLGFTSADVPALGEWLSKHPQLQVATIMSHLAASEAPEHDDFTHQQAAAFNETYETIVPLLGYRPGRHILNSSGIARFPEYQYEMVRLGIGLYGLESSGELQSQLQTVLELQARISQIRWVEAGQTVGYGRAGRLEKRTRVATLSIGYADGIPRTAGYGRFAVRINGQPAPTIGAICMDMMMVDVSEMETVAEGDKAVIFGEEPTITELAAAANTITYEILTNLSPRLHRVYVQE